MPAPTPRGRTPQAETTIVRLPRHVVDALGEDETLAWLTISLRRPVSLLIDPAPERPSWRHRIAAALYGLGSRIEAR